MNRATSAFGFHGTSKSNHDAIVANGFVPSENDGDWLGLGFYFFQDAPERAKIWAKRHSEPVVIGAEISLERCIDFFDVFWWDLLADAFEAVKKSYADKGVVLPVQTSGNHRRDRLVIDMAVDGLKQRGFLVMSIRAVFKEGKEAFSGSALNRRDHVQIAVRNKAAIIRTWIDC